MAVKLRLMRMGKKKQPVYRVVAADSRSPRDGRFIEILGTYEPRVEPIPGRHRQRQGRALAARRRPADRDGRPVAGAVRGHGRVQLGPGGQPLVTNTSDGRPACEYQPCGTRTSLRTSPGASRTNGTTTVQVDGGRAQAVLMYVAQQLVDDPDAVAIDTSETRRGIKLSLHVAPDDMGKVIGRRGAGGPVDPQRGARRGAKDGVDVIVDIVD